MKKFAICFLIALALTISILVLGALLLVVPTVIGLYGHDVLALIFYLFEFVFLVAFATYMEAK